MFPKEVPLSRRQLFRAAGAGSVASLLAWDPISAQEKKGAALAPLNRFPRMVQEYFVEQVRAAEQIGNEARAKLKTKADAEAYVRGVREKIATCFGPFPEKTPLNASVTGTVERDAYTIEKVIFESRPDFLVTANLYVPKGAKGPRPGVVGSCGHSANGKAAEAYQSFAQGLARHGLRRAHLRPDRPGRAAAVRPRREGPPAGRRRRRAPARGQPAVPRRRVLRHAGGRGTASARSTTC